MSISGILLVSVEVKTITPQNVRCRYLEKMKLGISESLTIPTIDNQFDL